MAARSGSLPVSDTREYDWARLARGVRTAPAHEVIGRDGEFGSIERFLGDIRAGASAFLLDGAIGIGKTTLWREGVAAAAERGQRVLGCRPVEAEIALPFAALGDLLEGVGDHVLAALPQPRREALEVGRPRYRWIAAIAVVVVGTVTGLALARPETATAPVTPAQAKQIAKAVADAEIKRLAPRLSVKSAASATAPAVYAQVTASGVVTGNSRGLAQANVIHVAKGVYCLIGLPRPPKGGVVTIDAAIPGPGSGGDLAQVGLGRLVHRIIGTCPAGTQAYVVTAPPGEFSVDDPFFVVLWW